jgi:phosphate transport system ATP-binding protein
MPPETHLRIRDLCVKYGSSYGLKNITADIPAQRITVIIGPSGCGKTTLLRSLNRLVDTREGVTVSGQIFVGEQEIHDPAHYVTEIRKRVGLLAQRPCPLPMSIYDNVAYGPRLHGTRDRATLDRIVEHTLREGALWEEVKDRLHTPASALSIGQQQRLCLARGLAVEPEVLLCDEPTSALDPHSSLHIEQRFLALKERYTIVMVTHILRQARRLADHVLFLYLGELIEQGSAEEVFGNPQHPLTRQYLSGTIS